MGIEWIVGFGQRAIGFGTALVGSTSNIVPKSSA